MWFLQLNVPVRIYQPDGPSKPVLLIFFHGGGYCIGSRDTHHGVCQSLAQVAKCYVASVEYRLAPENKFPAGIQDALACTEFLLSSDNRQSVGLPRDVIVGVSGDSAGGNFAAVMTHELKTKESIKFQILVYPGVDMSTARESMKRYAAGPLIDDKIITCDNEGQHLTENSHERDESVNTIPSANRHIRALVYLFTMSSQLSPMTFHPEATALIEQLSKSDRKRLYEMSPEDGRRSTTDFSKKFGSSLVEFKGTTRDVTCSKLNVPVRIYQPDGPSKPVLLIYFHGGGYCIGSRDTHHGLCQSLAQVANFYVASVEYRLAPENKFPAGIQDALACTEFLLSPDNRESVGLPRDVIVGVSGDSAGGNFAAVMTHELKTKESIKFQILVYPGVDMSTARESMKRYAAGPLLDVKLITWFVTNYLNEESEKTNPQASPLLYEDFSDLPPCLLIIAEHDPLFDESHAYGDKLKAAGVPVTVNVFEGQIHAFFSYPVLCKESCTRAYDMIAEFVDKQTAK
ncbi:ethyl acetate hydrolase-like [Corticium candelabrum]|uniref:ethyl acetate hydrolase-like n=1 Tax=Corticium candelabrum TaxID=121492 RepID=UPI002E255823|nr:ethyl acetate hydrolase-like [Corticium candelabrum]